jgi:tetratricopeptide (TPR) repeat protein
MVTACEGELEPVNYDKISTDNFLQTEKDFEVAVTAIYSSIGSGRRARIVFGERGTDEYRSNNGGEDRVNNFEWTTSPDPSSPDPFSGIYNSNIPAITRAGTLLLEINKSTVLSEAVRNSYLAQVRTARAFLLYELLTCYGACPAITNADILAQLRTNYDYQPERPRPGTSEYDAYQAQYVLFVETELTEAIAQFDLGNGTPGYNDFGRFNKAVAYMLLSKLYLHQKQWEKAEEACKAIIDLAEGSSDQLFKYKLVTNYNTMWALATEQHKEIIFAIPQTAGLYGQDFRAWTLHPHYTDKENAFNGDKVRMPFYDSFSANDIRRNNITIEFPNIYTGRIVDMRRPPHNGGFIFKYQPDPDGPMASGVDVVVYRLADVYLSYAEAICWKEGGTTSNVEALKYFNLVRTRAGLGTLSELTTDIILQERGWELYFEGFRREDLIRHGKYISKAREERGVNALDHQVLYPLPLKAILENPRIYQNPGYAF